MRIYAAWFWLSAAAAAAVARQPQARSHTLSRYGSIGRPDGASELYRRTVAEAGSLDPGLSPPPKVSSPYRKANSPLAGYQSGEGTVVVVVTSQAPVETVVHTVLATVQQYTEVTLPAGASAPPPSTPSAASLYVASPEPRPSYADSNPVQRSLGESLSGPSLFPQQTAGAVPQAPSRSGNSQPLESASTPDATLSASSPLPRPSSSPPRWVSSFTAPSPSPSPSPSPALAPVPTSSPPPARMTSESSFSMYTTQSRRPSLIISTSTLHGSNIITTMISSVIIRSVVTMTPNVTSSSTSSFTREPSSRVTPITTGRPLSKAQQHSNTGVKVGVGVGVGVGVPVAIAALALAWWLWHRRRRNSSPLLDESDEDPFRANIDQYHTTNAAANF